MTEPSAVRLVALEKRYGEIAAVAPLDLEIAAGEFVVLVGPSGCGKTTVLRMIAGLEEPTAGEVWIGGRLMNDVEPSERDIAMVFQNYALYPHMTVRENLGFGLRMRRVDRSERRRRIDRAAQVLGLEGLLDRRPAQLSGGQRQRVALGRALVREPRVFLFDEPLSNLDARLRVELRLELAQLHARLGTTMIFVTHDQVEAMTLGQRIAVLWAGSLQQYAPPLEIYRDPANRIVAEFVGTPAINTVTGELRPSGAGAEFHHERLRLTLPGVGASGPATLGIRPEALALASDANGADFTSEVVRVETLGSELHVHVRGPDDRPWIVRAPATATPAPGRAVGLRLDRSAILLFDRSGGRIR